MTGSPGSFTNIDAVRGSSAGGDSLTGVNLRNHWDLGGNVAGFGPYGAAAFNLSNSLANSGVLVADESDVSLTGNATVVGRPTGANPITPSGGEQDLAWRGFENLIGASTASDWFDLRHGASLSGTINGRGGNDSLDYRDFSTVVAVNLPTGTATNIFGGAAGGLVAGSGGATGTHSRTSSAATRTTRSSATRTTTSWGTASAAIRSTARRATTCSAWNRARRWAAWARATTC